MAPSRSISGLAGLIQKHATAIETFIQESGAPQPTLSVGTPPVLPLTPELEGARNELLDALGELQALVRGPMVQLFSVMFPVSGVNATLHGIYHYGIAKNLKADETLSHAALAERCGLLEEDLRRYLRMALSLRLFEEPESGMIRHNASSSILYLNSSANDLLGLFAEDIWPGSLKLAEALKTFKGSEEPTESACSISLGTAGEKDFYEAISDQPERVRRFANGMSLLSMLPTYDVAHFAKYCGFDKSESCPKKVVDIGGSDGKLCKAILEAHPGVREAVSTDRPEVVAAGQVPEHLKGRLKFAAYDFLTEQKVVQGADAYIFRDVFHNWSDKYAAKILRNQIPALKKGARIFVNELCLPDMDASTVVKNQNAWNSDMIMKLSCNAKNRTRQEWYDLFAKADERFKVVSIETPPQAALAIIEVLWEG